MKSIFSWSDSFLTGLPQVDDQHQQLVQLINDLGEMVMSADTIDSESFSAVRDRLLIYVEAHFDYEKSLMVETGLDKRHVQRHLSAHKTFANEALALSDLEDEASNQHGRQLTDYLVNWLAYHILDVDQSMARQVKAVLSGTTPEAAFEADALSVRTGTEPLLSALSGLFFAVSERNRELRQLNRELEQKVKTRTENLEEALAQVKQLSGLLPICASCKKIRDESGAWNPMESYISGHSEANFTHGVCPECAKAMREDFRKGQH